jgi:hypothetical protein
MRGEATEHQIQVAVTQWRDAQAASIPALRWLHAVPNGAKLPFSRVMRHGREVRVSKQGIILKREGLVSGVLDMFWPMPRGRHHGLYLEHKAGKNKPTAEQVEFAEFAEANGYAVQVSRDPDDSIEAIMRYWRLGPFLPGGLAFDPVPFLTPAAARRAKKQAPTPV